jgi:guanylate kinase
LNNKSGKLVIISGPSGVGKGTIVDCLLKKSDHIALSISCTTRTPRQGERDGVNYFFITRQQFEELIAQNGFLEYSNHFGNYYGTPKAFVEHQLEQKDVLLEIDVDGALAAKAIYPQALLIMIAPPDKDTLYARLSGRGTESKEVIDGRMARAQYELSKSDKYDYVVVNDVLEDAVDRILEIIQTA